MQPSLDQDKSVSEEKGLKEIVRSVPCSRDGKEVTILAVVSTP